MEDHERRLPGASQVTMIERNDHVKKYPKDPPNISRTQAKIEDIQPMLDESSGGSELLAAGYSDCDAPFDESLKVQPA